MSQIDYEAVHTGQQILELVESASVNTWEHVIGFCDGQDRWIAARDEWEQGRALFAETVAPRLYNSGEAYNTYCEMVDCIHSNIGAPCLGAADLRAALEAAGCDDHEAAQVMEWVGVEDEDDQ